MGKQGGWWLWLPAQLLPSPGMAQEWRMMGRQGRATSVGPGRLAEQLSLHRGGPRPLCAVNYVNLGKCVKQRMPCGAEEALCDALPAEAGRKQAAEAGGARVGCGCRNVCLCVVLGVGHTICCLQVTHN